MKLVSKCSALLSLLVLACCTQGPGEPPKVPQSVPPGWQLQNVAATRPELAPDIVRQLGFQSSWRAEYTGPGPAHVDLYRLKSEATGLEMMQRWPPRANTVTLFERRYFLVISWEHVDRAALTALITGLQKELHSRD